MCQEFIASGMQFRSFLLAFAGVTAATCVAWQTEDTVQGFATATLPISRLPGYPLSPWSKVLSLISIKPCYFTARCGHVKWDLIKLAFLAYLRHTDFRTFIVLSEDGMGRDCTECLELWTCALPLCGELGYDI